MCTWIFFLLWMRVCACVWLLQLCVAMVTVELEAEVEPSTVVEVDAVA